MIISKRVLGFLVAAIALAVVALRLLLSADRPHDMTLGEARVSDKVAPASVDQPQRAGASSAEAKVRLQRIGQMPLYFIENRGQLDSRVAYYVQGRDTTLYFTADGMTLAQTEQKRGKNGAKGKLEQASLGRGSIQTPDPVSRWVVKLDFVGANPNPKITAGDKLPAVVSYFKGPQENWKAGLSTYGSITYSNLWPGIDLVYSGTANRLKYTFLVKPGANPAQVRLAYRGVKGVRLNEAGQLEVETPARRFQDDKPYAYQEIEGRRVEIDVAYALDRASAGGPHRYGFALDAYDRSKPLVLDPAVFVYCGYIGGSVNDVGRSIAVDSSGNAYVTGEAASTEATFPVTVGPDLTFNGGDHWDAFVAKVNAAGTALVYCGYIGGNGDDYGYGIAVDSSGNAYITGETLSTEATFPVTVGPDPTFNGFRDAFVAKVNAAGTALDYCGYIGGSAGEIGYGIAVDTSGNAYVTGGTGSSEFDFPVTVGPDLTFNGGVDAFVAKVNAAGTALDYCGYIGGSPGNTFGEEVGLGIAVDSSGNAYVTGYTSGELDFPVTVGPDLTYNGGNEDAFVAKVNAAGTALVYCGYIGGDSGDFGYGIGVDGAGNTYVTGITASTEATFPVAVGPDLTYNGLFLDAFVAKVKADGTALVYCGYIGGSGLDYSFGIAADSSGDAYVTGYTDSTEATFPVTVGPDLTYNGAWDAFVAKVNAAGTALDYCGYIGGSAGEVGFGVAVDGSGNAYVTGVTSSSEFDFPVTVGPDLTYNGIEDAFVVKIGQGVPTTPTNTPTAAPPTATQTPAPPPPTATPTPTNTPPNPVILVHGWCGSPSESTWGLMKEELTNVGFKADYTTINTDKTNKIVNLAAQLNDNINDVLRRTGAAQVDIVAHSMGGLVTRALITGMAVDASGRVPYGNNIRRLVELATPNYGVASSGFAGLINFRCRADAGARSPQAQQMYFGSDFVWVLNHDWEGTAFATTKKHDVLTIVGKHPYPNRVESDGLVLFPSAALADPAVHARYVIRPHISFDTTPGIADVQDSMDESFLLVKQFLLASDPESSDPPDCPQTKCVPFEGFSPAPAGMLLMRLLDIDKPGFPGINLNNREIEMTLTPSTGPTLTLECDSPGLVCGFKSSTVTITSLKPDNYRVRIEVTHKGRLLFLGAEIVAIESGRTTVREAGLIGAK